MSGRTEKFKQLLKRGCNWETSIFNMLIKNPIYIILQTHDFKTNSYSGPRIYNASIPEGIILPDFYVIDSARNETFFIDAKLKSKAFLLPGGVQEYVGIDQSSVENYRICSNLFGSKLFYCIRVEHAKKNYMIMDQPTFTNHNFNNKYSRGPTTCIPLDDQYLINTI